MFKTIFNTHTHISYTKNTFIHDSLCINIEGSIMLLMNKVHLPNLLVCLSCKLKNEVPTESRRLRLKCFLSGQDPSDTTTLSRHGRGFFSRIIHPRNTGISCLFERASQTRFTLCALSRRRPHVRIFSKHSCSVFITLHGVLKVCERRSKHRKNV